MPCDPPKPNVTRLTIRGWQNGVLMFTERVDVTDDTDFDALALSHAEHLKAMSRTAAPHMIEFEFLDEADYEQRFLRIDMEAALAKLLEQYK
jgi:hypothetical protein